MMSKLTAHGSNQNRLLNWKITKVGGQDNL